MGDGPDYESMYEDTIERYGHEGRDPSSAIQDAYDEDVYRAEMQEAYDDDNYSSRYSSNKSNQSSDGCFIATAAYGSDLDIHVVVLRNFRDNYLNKNFAGRLFINAYYRVSPPVAEVIRNSDRLKSVTRYLLKPLITVISKRFNNVT